MKKEREELIAYIKGFDSFYGYYNFDLYSLEDLQELKDYIEEIHLSRL